MENIFRKLLLTVVLGVLLLPFTSIKAQENYKVGTYVGGIGCPHCAVVSPFLHDKVNEGGLLIIEYEMYKNLSNAIVLNNFADYYQTSLVIPLLVFN